MQQVSGNLNETPDKIQVLKKVLEVVLKYNSTCTLGVKKGAEEFGYQVYNIVGDNGNEIYNALSRAYNNQPISQEEINHYAKGSPPKHKSFLSYICCCRRNQNQEPRFVEIILGANSLFVNKQGTIVDLDEGLYKMQERASNSM
jgi:hypothetical protein